MGIETFYTAPSSARPAGQSGQQSAATGTTPGSAGGALGGNASFFDMFLGTALQVLDGTKTAATTDVTATTAGEQTNTTLNSLINATAQLKTKVAKIVPDETTENIGAELQMNIAALTDGQISADDPGLLDDPALADIIALSRQHFDETSLPAAPVVSEATTDGKTTGETALPSILSTLGIDQSSETFTKALGKLEKLLGKIETMIKNEDPQLSALNITPEQITDLQTQIAALKNNDTSDDSAALNALMAGLVAIVPPQDKPMIVVTGQTLVMSPKQLEVLQSGDKGTIKPSNDDSASATLQSKSVPVDTADDGELVFFDDDGSTGDVDFEKILKEFGKTGKENLLAKADSGVAAAQTKTQAGPPSYVLQGWPFGDSGSLFGPLDYSSYQYDQMGLSVGGQSTLTGASSAMTSLVTQSQSAAHAHPATQMVAATMQKAAQGGEASNIRLELDPPELGRVEIKMTFNKDKMSAVLKAEKPETYMMLQRDAHVLEKALQDAGLDISGEGALSFELADDGNFGQDGSHDGSRNQAGSQNNFNGNTDDIIETTMTWHVDPSTGHMRYNILA